MKYLVGLFLMLSVWGDNLKKASRINNLVQEAGIYYQQEQYRQATQLYQHLYDSLKVTDEQLLLNLAHASFMDGDFVTAQKKYTTFTKNNDSGLQSIALTQLGLIFFEKGNPEKALYNFKKALIQNPSNETARYNYELVKKHLLANPPPASPENKKKQENPQSPETAGQNKNDATNESSGSKNENQNSALDNSGAGANGNPDEPGNKNNEDIQPGNTPTNQGEKGNEAQGISELNDNNNRLPNQNKGGTETISEAEKEMQTLRVRLKNANLSPEKAKMLLEAMRNAELQYLQQIPRKQTKSSKQNGPDW